MLKKTLHLALLAALAISAVSCKEKKKGALPPGTVTEAQKAELRKKALDNYKKLAAKYPDSEHAAQAQERIQTLAPPGKK
jgi:hypothetical protein